MPRIRLRVVCGTGETIASCSPSAAFKNVDLPTFGLPTIAALPLRKSDGSTDFGSEEVIRSIILIHLILAAVRSELLLVRRTFDENHFDYAGRVVFRLRHGSRR